MDTTTEVAELSWRWGAVTSQLFGWPDEENALLGTTFKEGFALKKNSF